MDERLEKLRSEFLELYGRFLYSNGRRMGSVRRETLCIIELMNAKGYTHSYVKDRFVMFKHKTHSQLDGISGEFDLNPVMFTPDEVVATYQAAVAALNALKVFAVAEGQA